MAALTTIAALAAAGGAVASAFSSAKQKAPKVPPVPTLLQAPDPNAAPIVAERNDAAKLRRRTVGQYASAPDLLTGPNGLQGGAPVQYKTLLGS